jgi:Cu(I)/Ag(I) efflux system membrane fusion protein
LIGTLERQRALQTTWTVKAPHDGMVRQLSARAGMTLMAGAALADIQSLDPVWVEIAVPQQLVGAMRTGDAVAVRIDGVSPSQREGVIGEILPVVATDSSTVPVRVVLPNNDTALRPGMSAQVRILGDNNTSSLAVPSEALLHTGKRTLVMLDEGDGRYRPQTVLAGTEIGELTRIEAGLEEGQRVVVSGQFLLDSEASLLGLDAAPLPGHAEGHAHDDPLHYAVGTVEKLADGRVTLSHGPFESLDMPGMTMRFRLANEDVAAGIAVGDTVRIGVRDGDDGLVVERLLKQEPQK